PFGIERVAYSAWRAWSTVRALAREARGPPRRARASESGERTRRPPGLPRPPPRLVPEPTPVALGRARGHPRPSRAALPPSSRRDVGALLVLRDARAARALSRAGDPPGARRDRLRQSRTRLVAGGREPALRLVHGTGLPAADRRRVGRRSPARHAPLDG